MITLKNTIQPVKNFVSRIKKKTESIAKLSLFSKHCYHVSKGKAHWCTLRGINDYFLNIAFRNKAFKTILKHFVNQNLNKLFFLTNFLKLQLNKKNVSILSRLHYLPIKYSWERRCLLCSPFLFTWFSFLRST